MNILIIEDDKKESKKLEYLLTKEFAENTVGCACFGYEGLMKMEEFRPVFVLLDLHLPDLFGIEILKLIRNNPHKYGNPYIIITTTNLSDDIMLQCYTNGANDFLKKPISYNELLIKLVNLKQYIAYNLRHTKEKSGCIKHFYDLELLDDKKYCRYKGYDIKLEKKEYELLFMFMSNLDIVITRDEIMTTIWGSTYAGVSDRVVDSCICKLKHKIPFISDYFETVVKVGYKLRSKINLGL